MKSLKSEILTARELNRAMLARQLLLEGSPLPLVSAIEQVGGLQSQYAPAPYVGLWTRLQTFGRDDLTDALVDKRVLQGTLMRSTIHIVSCADYSRFAAGTGPSRRAWWSRVRRRELDGLDIAVAADRVRAFLADGPRKQREIVGFLEGEGYPTVAWQGVGQWLDLVRVPPSGTWEQRRADLYQLADEWTATSDHPTESDGLRHLLVRYLRGFGPAPLADAASWAGVPIGALRRIVPDVDLVRFRDEQGRELLDVPDGPLPDGNVPAPVRFLPVWEALLLVHARRTLVLPEAYRPLIFNTKNPQSFPTFLVDGVVAGTWRYDAGRVTIQPFERLTARVADELDAEALRLAAFYAAPATTTIRK
jgi:hypothetical protein